MAKPEVEPVFIKIQITKDVYAKLDAFKRKWPGAKVMDVMVQVEVEDGHYKEMGFYLGDFLEALDLEEANEMIKPCEHCGGIGEHVEVTVDEYDSDSHQYAPTGTAPCPAIEPDHADRDED